MRRSILMGLSLFAVFPVVLAIAGTSSAHQAGTTLMKVKAAHSGNKHGGSNLFYHGGAIEQSAKVYVVYWGPQWSAGFSTGGYTSGQAQTYVQDFFGGVGGSSWARSTTQYCQGVAGGTTQCGAGGGPPTNPSRAPPGTPGATRARPPTRTPSSVAAEASPPARPLRGLHTS